MKTALFLTVAFTAMMATPTQAFVKEDHKLSPTGLIVDEVIQGLRGFFMGFQQSLYKADTKVDQNCLNADSEAKIMELFESVFEKQFSFNTVVQVVTDFMKIFGAVESCVNKPIEDIAQFCFLDSADNCSFDKLFANIQKNLLMIIGKATDIGTVFLQGLPKDPQEAYNLGQTIGTNIGGLIRILLGFHE